MDKFAEFEVKLQNAQDSRVIATQQVQVVNEERLQVIRNTFSSITNGDKDTNQVTTQKIQELLLNFREGKKVTEEEIAEPLQMYYLQMKS